MKDAGVKYLFAAPGSAETGFFDAFVDQPMVLIEGLHEGMVIAQACGYAVASKGPAFVNLHVMGGTAQAAGQMLNAHATGCPLVITSGLNVMGSFNDKRSLSPRPGWDQAAVNKQFTKMSWESTDGKALAHQIRRVFKMATTEPTGPAWLHCTDVAFTTKDCTQTIYPGDEFMLPNTVPANADQIKAVASALLAAKNPVLWVGSEVYKQSGEPEAVELAELLGLPVCSGGWASAVFPVKHPLYAGGFASKGRDLVVGFGCVDLSETAGGLQIDTPIVLCSLDTESRRRNQAFSMGIVANTKIALRQLIDELKGQATAAQLKSIADARMANAPNAGAIKIDPAVVGRSPIHRDEMGLILEEELDKEAIIVPEQNTAQEDFFSYGPRAGEKGCVSLSGGSLGWGVGASCGAKVAQPDRQVVAWLGDGGTMFGACGFWTQARSAVPVLSVVGNNHNYETVRMNYERYAGRQCATQHFIGMMLDAPDIDFVGLAKSEGCAEGIKVTTGADMRAALKRGQEAVAAGTPFLIDVDLARQDGPCGGGKSTWHQEFSLAQLRTRKI